VGVDVDDHGSPLQSLRLVYYNSVVPILKGVAVSRVALVTGSGQATGRGIARGLAASGFAIAVNDLHADRAEETVRLILDAGGQAIAAPFDCTNRDAIFSAVAGIAGELGPVDVLVNNAGVPESWRPEPFIDSDPASWSAQFDLNLFGNMHAVQAVAPGMAERGWGRVIQISSGSAATGQSIGVSLYAAAKAGIEGLLRHVATELGPSGVTVNTLSLGVQQNVVQRGVEAIVRGIPVRRAGRPADVAAAVCWLASDDGGFVSGQVIHINGGSYNGR
jgi:NAD(P)-dependent dehydrogenase (short-subunit alcohol dehydrogenase family)